jgi:hypothetical protein
MAVSRPSRLGSGRSGITWSVLPVKEPASLPEMARRGSGQKAQARLAGPVVPWKVRSVPASIRGPGTAGRDRRPQGILWLKAVRKLPRWHRNPDMLPRTVISAQDSRLRIRASLATTDG